MLFIIWSLLIILGFLFPKSKIVSAMMLGFMLISICFRTEGADYTIYKNEYIWSEFQVPSDVHYVGFWFIEQYAHSIGLQFEQFRVCVGILSCLLFWFGIRRISINTNIVLSLFFIYPFSHEAVQVRTFLANATIIAALPLVICEPIEREKNKKHLLESRVFRRGLFLTLSIVGCLFHFEAVISLFFIILMLYLPEKYSKEYIIVGAIIAFLLIELNILPQLVAPFNTRIAFWLSGKTGIGIVIPIAISLIIWFAMQIAGKGCINQAINQQEVAEYKKLLRYSDFIFLLIPLFCYDITFNRVWRLFLLMLYVMIARLFPYKISKNLRLWIIFLLCIIFVSICPYESVFRILNSLFSNNEIIG